MQNGRCSAVGVANDQITHIIIGAKSATYKGITGKNSISKHIDTSKAIESRIYIGVHTKMMKKLSLIGTIVIFIFCCNRNLEVLSDQQIKKILAQFKNEHEPNNYHVRIDSLASDTKLLHLWINNRLADTISLFGSSSLCRYFSFEEGFVFVYENKDCNLNLPDSLITKYSNPGYEYLMQSPFFSETGVDTVIYLVKRRGEVQIEKAELLIDTTTDKAIDEFLRSHLPTG